jgi:RNA polymerase sigma-70 factor (ECF subfamily)
VFIMEVSSQQNDVGEHLSGQSTPWELLRQARDQLPAVQHAARAALLERYGPLIRRYFGGAFRGRPDQQEAIDECLQRFGVRLCEGAFDTANPQRGRFRDYLKRSLRNLAVDYLREHASGPAAELPDLPVPDDGAYDEMHRLHLVQRALAALERQSTALGQQYHLVLRLRMAQPDWSMEQLAAALSQGGASRSANWVKQQLFRGRERLCVLLRAEVASELQSARAEDIEEELAALRLLEYCQR